MAHVVRLFRRGGCAVPLRRIVLWLIFCGLGAQAFAHTRLTGSEPVEGEALAAGADAVTLAFSEPIQPRFSDFALYYLGATPETAPTAANRLSRQPAILDASRRHVAVPLPDAPRPGWYALDWEVIADDGHRIGGTLRFQTAR